MTVRAIVLGLLGASVICGITFFNDMVMRGTFLVGNFVPFSVYGTLVLFLLLVNPLLGRAWGRLRLSGRELAVIVAVTLCACYLPGRGLLHYCTTFLMMPHQFVRTTPSWQGDGIGLTDADVLDWPAMTAVLRRAARGDGTPAQQAFCERLPTDVTSRLAAATEEGPLPADVQTQVVAALNVLLTRRELASVPALTELSLPRHLTRLATRSSESLSGDELGRLNRGRLEAAFPGLIRARHPSVLEHVPPRMLADPSQDSTRALDGFVTGLAEGSEQLSLRDVPWFAWRRTFWFWVPLILTMCATVMGLALLVHRQWADREHLPYPTVEFTRALLPAAGQAASPMLHNRLFWIGLAVALGIHMNNYACCWWPDYLIPVSLRFNFSPLLEAVPLLKRGPTHSIFTPTIYFMAIGFAYLLATDVSFSLGIAPYAACTVLAIFATYGVAFGGGHLKAAPQPAMYGGAFFGMFLVLLYTGRRYYLSALKRSVWLPAGDPVESHAVFGMRIFLVGFAAFCAQLVVVGLDWQLAVLYTCGLLVIFVVCSRLLTEAGVFFLHCYFAPCAMLWGFLGARAIGPDQLLIMAMVSSLMVLDPRESLMGFAVSGLRLVDRAGGRVKSTAGWGMTAVVIGLAIALPTTLYLQYQYGAVKAGDGWTVGGVPRFAFNLSSEVRNTLEAQGQLAAAQSVSGWGHFAEAAPEPSVVWPFLTTFSLVLLFSFLRRRYAWWPIHPLIFLVLETWQTRQLAFSFFLGWAVKAAVTKYGGAGVYQRLKPLMYGLIAGELVAGVLPMIIGAVYYAVAGKPPVSFRILPG